MSVPDLGAYLPPGCIPTGAQERHDIRHICPECGGNLATHTGLILIQTCWACRGAGTLSNDEMSWYQAELYRRTSG